MICFPFAVLLTAVYELGYFDVLFTYSTYFHIYLYKYIFFQRCIVNMFQWQCQGCLHWQMLILIHLAEILLQWRFGQFFQKHGSGNLLKWGLWNIISTFYIILKHIFNTSYSLKSRWQKKQKRNHTCFADSEFFFLCWMLYVTGKNGWLMVDQKQIGLLL